MNKVSSRKRDRLGRMLDSGPVYAIAALILLVLLASFYAVLLVNMNAIDTKTEDLKQHPYTVTVASGRTETLLMQFARSTIGWRTRARLKRWQASKPTSPSSIPSSRTPST